MTNAWSMGIVGAKKSRYLQLELFDEHTWNFPEPPSVDRPKAVYSDLHTGGNL